MLRVILILVLAILVVRYVRKVLSANRTNKFGRTPEAAPRRKLDESRIQDATFKDISDK
jgi:hypothetical protein